MSIVKMNRLYSRSTNASWFEQVDFGGLFVLSGLAAIGFGAYQAYQGGANSLLWIAMGLIVNQAGVCIMDAKERVNKFVKEAEEDERRASNQRQIKDLYAHIGAIEEKRKHDSEKEANAMWQNLNDLRDDLYELKAKSYINKS
jgi:hypothetical protein